MKAIENRGPIAKIKAGGNSGKSHTVTNKEYDLLWILGFGFWLVSSGACQRKACQQKDKYIFHEVC
jgi:hypothetical protein